MCAALDLAVHWLITNHELDKAQRELIESEWNGPLTSVERDLPPEDAWAPVWWHGDDDAVRSSEMAAVALTMGRRG